MTDYCRPVQQSFWQESLSGPKANFELKLQIYHNGKAEGNIQIISLPCIYNYNQKKWNYNDIGIRELKENLYERGVFGNVPFNLIVLFFCGKALMEYDVNSKLNDTKLSKIGFLDNLSQTYPLEYKIFSSDADVKRVFEFNCGSDVPNANGHLPPRHKPYRYLKSMGEKCLNGTIIYAHETNTSYCKKLFNERQAAPAPVAPAPAPVASLPAPVAPLPVAPIIRNSNKAKQELKNINNLLARIRNQQAKLNRFIQVQPAGQIAGKRKTKRSKRKNRKTMRNQHR